MTTIANLMQTSHVTFGTSGARGLVSDMTDWVCYAYTLGFIQYLRETKQLQNTNSIALAGDLRQSTPSILNACAKAIIDSNLTVIFSGYIPTPAVALYGLAHNCPSIMVTGSHIPDDRNGIKFYKIGGEILKDDEQLMQQQTVIQPKGLFADNGHFINTESALPNISKDAHDLYQKRYTHFFPDQAFNGLTIGVYQHSGVARELLADLLSQLGATVIKLGFSETFTPVDTEAIRPEDITLGKQWASEHQLDAIISTDGDADRPLIADENGHWFRGDIVGVLCADYLGIQHIVTPINSNTCVEKSGHFADVKRTKIGSPFVIEAMNEYVLNDQPAVAGYEANGGFLLATATERNGHQLTPLPTRDAVIVLLSLIHLAKERGLPLSALSQALPQRFTDSNRLKNFPTEKSQQLIKQYTQGTEQENHAQIEASFPDFGEVQHTNTLDGLRITFDNDDIIHFRPSGNAPEFRCYSESNSVERATQLNQVALKIVRQ